MLICHFLELFEQLKGKSPSQIFVKNSYWNIKIYKSTKRVGYIVHPADSSCNNGLVHGTCGCPSELLIKKQLCFGFQHTMEESLRSGL